MRSAILAAILGGGTIFGQTFDVASLKPSSGAPIGMPNRAGGPGTRSPERFTANTTLQVLVYLAHGLLDPQQIAGPAWTNEDKFAVDARMPPGTTQEQFQVMLQNLLVERFKLTVHHESIVLSVYQLVIAKGGPKLKLAASAGPGTPLPAGMPDHDREGFPILPPGSVGMIASYSGGHGRWRAQQETMTTFAERLRSPNSAGRLVVDKTGLTGKYDFMLSYDLPRRPDAPERDAEAPTLSIFDALEQQLGLKLVDAKETFDKIVIDHADRAPAEN